MTDKEYDKNARLEQNKVLLCSSLAFYLALRIYNKELNKLLFCSGQIKTMSCLNYDITPCTMDKLL